MTALGLDIGTSAVKGLLLDVEGRVVGSARRSYRLELPAPGRVELPAERVWHAAAAVIASLAAQAKAVGSPVRAIAASGSGDEVVMVDAAGAAVGPVIVALDGRADRTGAELAERFGAAALYTRTGLAVVGMAPLVRFAWLQAHEPARADKVRLLLAWPEFMALRLGLEPRSEPSLAGRTIGYDLVRDAYAPDLLAAFGVDERLLPAVVDSGTPIGVVADDVAANLGLPRGAVVVAGGFDQAMATLGAGVLDAGAAHVGTGSYEALTAVLETPLIDVGLRAGGWSVGRSVTGSARWAAMSSWVGGAALGWLAHGTSQGLGSTRAWPAGPSPSPARLLREMPDGPARLLAHSALDDGEGVLAGLDLGTRRGDITAAIVEAVTMDLRRALAHLATAGVDVRMLRATGGGARSRRWLQLKADITGRVVERPTVREAGAFAAGLLAGAAVGWLPPTQEACRQLVRVDMRVEPRRDLEAHYADRAAMHTELHRAMRDGRAATPLGQGTSS